MNMLSSDELTTFPPKLRKNVTNLLSVGKIGISPFTANDLQLSNFLTEADSTYSYLYTIKFNYAGKKLSWDIIFNPDRIDFAPDFNFNDDSFLMSQEMDLVVENVPSLVDWNVNDGEALSKVLSQFLALYKKQHEYKLEQDNIVANLFKQYQRLISENMMKAEDMEIYLDHNSAHFLFRIGVNLANLPIYNQTSRTADAEVKDPGADSYNIKIVVVKSESSAKTSASLQLSPRLEQILDVKKLRLPEFSKDTALTFYVSKVREAVQSSLNAIEKRYTQLKKFFTQLCNILALQMIEFDAKNFHRATFLLEENEFSCLLDVEIDSNPNKSPSVKLHAVDCMCSNKNPCNVTLNYTFNPSLSVDKMVNELLNVVKSKMEDLKQKEYMFGKVV